MPQPSRTPTPTRRRSAALCLALIAAVIAFETGPGASVRAQEQLAPPVELLVGFHDGVDLDREEAAYRALGASRLEILRGLNIHRLRLPADRASEIERVLAARREVRFVERNRLNRADSGSVERVEDELLVGVESAAAHAQAGRTLGAHGGATLEQVRQTNVQRVRVPPSLLESAAARLAATPGVKFVERQHLHRPAMVPDDASLAQEWHLAKIGAPHAWDIAPGAPDIVIAILDSGVDPAHPDLASKLVPGYNFHDGNANTTDVFGHGTKVAGAAAALGDNHVGVAGVAWQSRIMPVRVSDTSGSAYTSAIANGITWAADHGARVINLSFAGLAASSTVTSAARYALGKGVVVVASAGNCGCVEPAPANPYLLSVSATDSSDRLASFSSRGDYVDVAAPGVGILTTIRGGSYGTASGTSFSSPITAGVVALMMSANRNLGPGEITDLLKANSDDFGTAGWDPSFGFGRVNAARAVSAAFASTAPSPSPALPPPPANVTSFRAVDAKTGGRLDLAWTNQSTAAGTLLLRRTGGPVSDTPARGRTYRVGESIGSSVVVYLGPSTQTADVGLTDGTTYSYRAFTYDVASAYSAGVSANGTPSALAATSCPSQIVVDNQPAGRSGSGVTFTGRWSPSSLSTPYGANGSLYSSGTGGERYTWETAPFSSTSTCTYEVALWWVSGATRSTAVPVTVAGHAGGSTTRLVNQQAGGSRWQSQGVYTFPAAAHGSVTVSDAHGTVSADSVRFVLTSMASTPPAPNTLPIVIDNGAGGTSSNGAWCRSSGPRPFGPISLYACGSNGDAYRWTPTVPARATYDVYVWWTSLPSRSMQVPITVVHAGGPTTRRVNQQSGGGTWQLHGRYTFNAGTGGFISVNDTGGPVSADAVRLVPAP